eukprot:TRINITY_DN2840_c0_g1_i1.p2 TRINITY_DN2840_c0_g1~~TRINITY_DN2840_c0_g1_i1.p2  ORF type:complete len:455 (-),score=95.51 TRINITY_DN2840_c0_g1_i1:2154-3488(-)
MAVEVTFRTLTGATFKLTAEPTETVLDIKRKVAGRENVSDYASYRLIFKGKILSDDATVSSAGISSTGFVVVMPPKKKPAKPASTSTATPAPAPASAPASSPTPTPASKPANQPPAASTSASTTQSTPAQSQPTTSSAAQPSGPSSLVVGPEYDQTVRRICEMGFPEPQVKKALRAAFNNPDRAVDYLFNGIPESAMPSAPPAASPTATPSTQPSAATDATPNQPDTDAPAAAQDTSASSAAAAAAPFNMFEAAGNNPSAGGAGGSGRLGFLRSVPQFNLMRRLIQSNPAVLPQLLQQLENVNPSLMALINENHSEFMRLINEPITEGEDGGDAAMEQLAQAMAGAGGGRDGPGPGQILVTEEEHEQLHRLNELAAGFGLERAQVVETWLACDRNENLAANYLVENAEQLRADQAANAAAAAEQDNNGQNQSDRTDQGNQGPPS